VPSGLAREALPNRIWTGLSRARLGRLTRELAGPWTAAREDRLLTRRGHARPRAPGAGPHRGLPFTGRVIVTLIHPRFQLPHTALATFYRMTALPSPARPGVRPLLAAHGFAVPGEPGARLRTLEG
jgi:hypothetical protein